MAYVSWSEGFKSGGFNQRYNAAPPGNAPISFGAETRRDFEFGLKLNPTARLRVKSPRSRTDYDDIQMTYRLGVVPLLFNAGKASIEGGEVEMEFARRRPDLHSTPASVTSIGIRQHHAAAAIWPRSAHGDCHADSRLPFTPECRPTWDSLTASAGSGWTLTPRVDISYTD